MSFLFSRTQNVRAAANPLIAVAVPRIIPAQTGILPPAETIIPYGMPASCMLKVTTALLLYAAALLIPIMTGSER
ncbi:MAG: hypothetical protein M0P20_04130 [Methanocorpusculum sp.]|nr:hypothetical protein [Methanocorpusculum sp.]